MWRVGEALAAEGFTAVAADLPGHGNSPQGADYTFAAMAREVLAVAERWDVVVGHSMGAAIALIAATSSPAWADRLVLVDPALHLVNAAPWLREDFVGEISTAALLASHPEWTRRDAELKAEALLAVGWETVETTLEANDPWDVRELIGRVPVPTLVVGGSAAKGALVTPAIGRALEQADPNIRHVHVDGTHSMHRDAWAEFWTAVRPFVTGIHRE